jgi:glutathione peroxidase
VTIAPDFTATTIDGDQQPLSAYVGQVLLIVNTASECGYTPHYAGLQLLYEKYGDQGLVVLGFPCDQFGRQEPGDEEQIKSFCTTTYGITFPMFAKVEVNGPGAHPLFAWLEEDRPGIPGGDIAWNFTKFLVDRSGRPVARYHHRTEPAELAADIEWLLAA